MIDKPRKLTSLETIERVKRPETMDPDFVLRCVRGRHRGHFVYLNLVGEQKIGSSAESTLCVIDARLQPEHCLIVNDRTEKCYRMQDVSKQKGIWIKVADVSSTITDELMIDGQVYLVEPGRPLKQLAQLIKLLNKPIDVSDDLLSMRLEQIVKLDAVGLSDKLMVSMDIAGHLLRHAKEILRHKFVGRSLKIVHSGTQQLWLEAGWQQERKNLSYDQELVIQFMEGKHMVYTSGDCEVYMKVKQGSKTLLIPDDVLLIGDLTLQVQRFNAGHAENQGTRVAMLDMSKIIQEFLLYSHKRLSFTYLAIYGGHGVKNYVQSIHTRLHSMIWNNLEKAVLDQDNLPRLVTATKKAIEDAFFQCDKYLLKESKHRKWERGGCTVCGALIFGKYILCFNLGDSKVILCRSGEPIKLNTEHKATNPHQAERVKQAGGYIKDGRVLGAIQVSRSLGDFEFKSPHRQHDFLITQPEITFKEIDELKDEFLIMGSDGLFEAISEREMIGMIRDKLTSKADMEQDPQAVSEEVVAEAVRRNKERYQCSDNVSLSILCFSRQIRA